MASIQPIATTRVTDVMARSRLTGQIQQDQLELFRLQNQLSTGFRVFVPSDDAAAAQRAMVLQRTIERKDQSAVNLQGVQSALSNAENALADVSNQLNLVKSEGLGAIDTIVSEQQRQQLVQTIDGVLNDLVRVGNSTFTGSFLFGGTETASPPFEGSNLYVEYLGDEGVPQQYVDIGFLFESAVPGDEALGGLSESVRGGADLDPQLAPETRVAQINGGAGIAPNGAIELTFNPAAPGEPNETSVIELSAAETLGDVARLIESGSPAGSGVVATISGQSLVISSTEGEFTIGEVSGGTTADELGILNDTLSATVTGTPLDPTIRVTTPLSDLGGTKSRGLLQLGGSNNDLSLVAAQNGAAFDGLTVDVVDGAALGSETAVYDDVTNTLTITVADGESTAAEVAAAINDEGTFIAATDYRDALSGAAQGTGAVTAVTTPIANVTAGGSGAMLDLASGLQITNGEDPFTLDTSTAQTVEDLLSLLNQPENGLSAAINEAGDGIDVRTRRSGADFAIGENGGTTATDLGIRSYTEASRLEDFNRGVGVLIEGDNSVETLGQNSFDVTVVEDGVTTTYQIDPSDALTVGDLIQQISADTGGAIEASLAAVGNGLTLVATDPDTQAAAASGAFTLGADTLTIEALATGTEGNRPFTVQVFANNGGTALDTAVVGDAITVDLGGAAATTAQIAAAIEGALPGFTVVSSGADAIASDIGPLAADTTGGQVASAAAVAATGGFTLNGDPIVITADSAGPGGNAAFTVDVVDTGVAGLETTVAGNVITVNLGGANSTTDAIAASIDAELSGYSVASDGSIAVLQADVGSFAAPVTGGRAVDSITVSGDYARRLGFVPEGETSVTVDDGEVTSTDRNPQEADSVFTTLLRMRDALEADDIEGVSAELTRLDDDLDRVSFARSDIGARLRNLQTVQTRLEDENVALRSALSEEIDADLTEVIADLTAQQFALQASLQTAGTLLQLSILDFI